MIPYARPELQCLAPFHLPSDFKPTRTLYDGGANRFLEAALASAKKGFRVFPVVAGYKRPLIKDWEKEATTNREQIEAWFKQWPDANHGITCGPSELFILDLDKKNGKDGAVTLFELEDKNERLPATLAINTPSGGQHLYFYGNGASSAGKIGPGVDTRGQGGYVVGPGSYTVEDEKQKQSEGYYSIAEDRPVATAPEWITQLAGSPIERSESQSAEIDLDQPGNVRRAIDFLKRTEPAVERRGGDNHTYKTACVVRDFGISADLCADLMAEHFNHRCEPPWPQDELETVIRHVYDYAKREPGEARVTSPKTVEFMQELARDFVKRPHVPANDAGPEKNESPVGDEVAAAIEKINAQYAVIMGGKNKGNILDTSDRFAPTILTPARFHTAEAPRKLPGDNGKRKSASRVWLEHGERKIVSGVVFEPDSSRVPAKAYNAWQGFKIEAQEGNEHERFLDHVETVICGGDRGLCKWVLDWLADLVQQPGQKPGTAIMLRSPVEGTGKTIVCRVVAAIVDPYAVTISRTDDLTGKFNTQLQNKLFIALEEAIWGGEKRNRGQLKHLVTGATLMAEAKGVDAYEVSNHARIIGTTNEDRALPIGAHDRRWLALDVKPDRKDDKAYFAPLWEGLNNGLLPAHLMRFLLDRRYDKTALMSPPMTRAKVDQIVQNDDVVAWLVDEGLANGRSIDGAPKDQVKTAFDNWLSKRQRYPMDAGSFWKKLKDYLGHGLVEKRVRAPDARERRVFFEIEVCREALARKLGCEVGDIEF